MKKLTAGIKKVIKSRRTYLILLILAFAGSIGYLYYDLSKSRGELHERIGEVYTRIYEVREETYSNFYSSGESTQVKFEVLNQTVETLRIEQEYVYKEDYEPEYKETAVRVVEVKISNPTDYVFSYYGGLGYKESNGVITRDVGTTLHHDDDKNPKNLRGGFELAPSGEVTIFVYFLDTGKEIDELLNNENYF